MPFYLHQIELQFPEELVAIASNAASNHERTVSKVQSGVYVIQFEEEESIEVEVVVSGNIIKRFACDCAPFLATKECVHVVEGLMHLRVFLAKQTQKKRAPKPKAPAKLSVPTILNSVNEKKLLDFIRSYSRKDKYFGIALKARFIRETPLDHYQGNKYDDLLSTIVKIRMDGQVHLSRKDQKLLSDVLKTFHLHFQDSLALKHHLEAVLIIEAVLKKIHLLIDKNDTFFSLFQDQIAEVYYDFSHLCRLQLSPELNTRVIDFAIELGGRTFYRTSSIRQNIFFIVHRIISENEKLSQVSDIILNNLRDSRNMVSEYWGAIYIIVSKGNMSPLFPLSARSLIGISQNLRMANYVHFAEDLFAVFDETELEKMETLKYYEEYLEIARAMGDKPRIRGTLASLLARTKSLRYFQEYRDTYESAFTSDDFLQLQEILNTFLNKNEENVLIPALLDHLEWHEELMEYVEREPELISVYMSSLAHHFSERLYDILKQNAREILDRFAGMEMANRIQEILLLLSQNQMDHQRKDLLDMIKSEYPEREQIIKSSGVR